jgi:hypothetical protein
VKTRIKPEDLLHAALFVWLLLFLCNCTSMPKHEEGRGPAAAGALEKRLAKEEEREETGPGAQTETVEAQDPTKCDGKPCILDSYSITPLVVVNPEPAKIENVGDSFSEFEAREAGKEAMFTVFREDIIRQCMNTGCGITLPSLSDLKSRIQP